MTNDLGARLGTNSNLTITRLIALDYYDGPTSGLVSLSGNDWNRPFYFELISWDEGRSRRVFALAELPNDTILDDLTNALGPSSHPRRPIWFPSWTFETEAEKTAAERIVEQAKSERSRAMSVMCGPDNLAWIELPQSLGPARTSLLERFAKTGELQPFEEWRGLFSDENV